MRISKSNLETMFGHFVKEVLQGDWKLTEGGYQLANYCGKWGIVRMSNDKGGESTIIPNIYTKKELYEHMEFALYINRHKEN